LHSDRRVSVHVATNKKSPWCRRTARHCARAASGDRTAVTALLSLPRCGRRRRQTPANTRDGCVLRLCIVRAAWCALRDRVQESGGARRGCMPRCRLRVASVWVACCVLRVVSCGLRAQRIDVAPDSVRSPCCTWCTRAPPPCTQSARGTARNRHHRDTEQYGTCKPCETQNLQQCCNTQGCKTCSNVATRKAQNMQQCCNTQGCKIVACIMQHATVQDAISSHLRDASAITKNVGWRIHATRERSHLLVVGADIAEDSAAICSETSPARTNKTNTR
jgi:hypothetical protein